MKTIVQTGLVLLISTSLFAQTQSPNKLVLGAEKVNQQATKTAYAAQEVSNQLHSASQQAHATAANVKSIIALFDPIRQLHRKRNKAGDSTTTLEPEVVPVEVLGTSTATPMAQSPTLVEAVSPALDNVNAVAFVPENHLYNPDGSANLGNQNHEQFGCYLDMMRGQILDGITVATETQSVDLIFTATDYFNSQLPMYALLTPSYAKNELAANYYFRGPNYKDANVPPKTWPKVNESEIALTTISPVQFERIQNNNQLAAIVQQTQGFKSYFESRTKLTGKTFAVKTEMGNRTCYGLLYVVEHLGTTGTNGFLKVRLKVTGFDANSDGYPDAAMYLSK